jgi:hypothetical protein
MSEVFSVRSLIYWWAALSSTIFLKGWLKQFAEFMSSPGTFIKDKFPFNILPAINSSIDGLAEYIRSRIGFNPNVPILTAPILVPAWTVAVIFALAFVGLGVAIYVRALRSLSWLDDFLALFGIYVLLRLEGHITALTALPVLQQVRDLVNNPTVAFVILLILLLVLIFFGEGFRSKGAFWRALVEGLAIAVFMFPLETANVLTYVIQGFSGRGTSLSEPANAPFAIVWGAIGMLLALQRLIRQERAEIHHG